MSKSLFNNGVDKALDILKSYLFYIRFNIDDQKSKIGQIYSKFGGGANNALTIRARQAKWAGKSFDELSTIFMASKVTYPGMPKVDGELKINFDEFQDTLVIKFFSAWMNLIYNSNFSTSKDSFDDSITSNITQGGSVTSQKKDYSCDISVYITDSTTNYSVPIYCKFYNCFPKELTEMSLDTTNNASVKPEITFKYDYFEYKDSTDKGPDYSNGPLGQNLYN